MIYFPQYYLCGEKQFTNLFQAFDHQKNTGHFPHYEIDPELIESLKHIKRPKNLSTQYIRDLIIKGLRQIRNKNSKLRLCLGGGTDSWTILDVCIKNDIYLDEVVTGLVSFEGDVRADLEYLPAIAYAKNHEGQQIGTVKAVRPTSSDLEYLDMPEWYKKTRGRSMPCRPFFDQWYDKELTDPDWTNVTGWVKPAFKIEDGKVFLCHLDGDLGEWMGMDFVPLWIDKHNPELHVAMAYTMLDLIPSKKLIQNSFVQITNLNDTKLENKILGALGMQTPRAWLNLHFLGKKPFDQNIKTKYFNKELSRLRLDAFNAKYIESMTEVYEQYKDLPYAVEKIGNFVQTIGRYSQKIPILQDKFGG